MKNRALLATIVLSMIGGILSPVAGAATITPLPAQFGPAIPQWTGTISVSQFDPALGALYSVDITLSGAVTGSMGFENRTSSPATVNMTLVANLIFTDPRNGIAWLTVSPAVSTSDTVTAFDNVLDLGGTSGLIHSGLANAASQQTTLSSNLGVFQGIGTVAFPVKGEAASTASGPGALTTQFDSWASAGVEVAYNYTPIPEPSTLALLSLAASIGLLACAWRWRWATNC